MKVIHVPYGAPMIELCKAQRMAGIDAVSCHLRPNKYHFTPDILLELNPKSADYRKQISLLLDGWIKEFDIFHFHFGETLLPDKSDLRRLKHAGKKLVVHHNGSDIRMESQAKKMNPYVRVKEEWPEKKIRQNLSVLSSYIDHAVVKDHELAAYIKPFYKHVHIIRQPVDTAVFPVILPKTSAIPTVVHAPTARNLKGTEHILAAVDRLKKEGMRFGFRLLEKSSHKDTLTTLSQADLVIDQLLIGEIGRVSLEAMASGKTVICYIRPDLQKKYPVDFPVIQADPDTVYDVLKNTLSAQETWPGLGKSGRRYIEKFHDPLMIGKKYLNLYQSL